MIITIRIDSNPHGLFNNAADLDFMSYHPVIPLYDRMSDFGVPDEIFTNLQDYYGILLFLL